MTFNCVGVDDTGDGDSPQGVGRAALPCPNTLAGMRFSEGHFLGVDPPTCPLSNRCLQPGVSPIGAQSCDEGHRRSAIHEEQCARSPVTPAWEA